MKNRAKVGVPAQVGAELLFTAQQLLLPMIEGIVHSRRELFSWVQCSRWRRWNWLDPEACIAANALTIAGVRRQSRCRSVGGG